VVKAAPVPAQGQVFIRDAELAGFALRITANNARSFVFEARVHGRFRRRTLGTHPALTVIAARDLALQAKAAIYRGEDPFAERDAERAALTLAEVARRFVELYAKPRRKSWSRDKDRLDRHFTRWHTRTLADITPEDCARQHQRIALDSGPIEANRAIQVLRLVYTWARRVRIYDGPDPTADITMRERARERFLNSEELDRVNEALDAEPAPWPAFFRLLLLLGTRKSELLGARWSDVDLDARVLRLSTTKAKRAHSVPLPEAEGCDPQRADAVAILLGLPSAARRGGFLFPSVGKSGHLTEPKSAWDRVRKRAGVEDVRIHDLRRTFGSWLGAAGNSTAVIGKALNHASPSSTLIYTRLDLDPVRRAMDANAAAMFGARTAK
jgi:integrase